MKIAPVGVFNVTVGLTSPNPYSLMPCASLETLTRLEEKLAADADYQKAARPFLAALPTPRLFAMLPRLSTRLADCVAA